MGLVCVRMPDFLAGLTFMRVRIFVFFVACLMVVSISARPTSTLHAMVTVPPIQYLVKQIGADFVQVYSLVRPEENPELYEPRPKQLRQLSKVDVYFSVDLPFERRWRKPFTRLNRSLRWVELMPHPECGKDDHDPHVWTDPLAMIVMAKTVKNTLQTLDPTHHSIYHVNYLRLISELKALHVFIQKQFAQINHRSFMVFHPAWGCFANRYHLRQLAVEHHGKTPHSNHLAHLIDVAKQRHLNVIYGQPQFSERSLSVIAKATNSRVIMLDPLAPDYLANMRQVATVLAKGMRTHE